MVAQTVLDEGALERVVEEEVRGLVGRLAQSRSGDEAEGMAQERSRRLGRLVLEQGLHLRLDRFNDRWQTRREHMRQAA